MNTIRTATAAATAGMLALASACTTAPMRDDRPAYNTQSVPVQRAPIAAEYGRVEQISVVPLAQRTSGAGAVLGAVLGAVVGNQFGSGSGRAAATVAGAVGGGFAGNAVEGRNRRDDEVYRVTVRFENGGFRDYDFREIGQLRVGDRVKLEDGQIHLV